MSEDAAVTAHEHRRGLLADARRLRAERSLAGMEAVVQDLLREHPTYVPGLREAVRASFLREEWVEAARRFDILNDAARARDLHLPDDDVAIELKTRRRAATALRKQGGSAAADKQVGLALIMDPDHPWTLREAARISIGLRRWGDAADRMERALTAEKLAVPDRVARYSDLVALFRSDLSNAGALGDRPLMVVDDGVDRTVLAWQLDRVRPCMVLSHRPLTGLLDPAVDVRLTRDFKSIGTPEDAELATVVADEADRALQRLAGDLPASERHVRGVDLIEVIRFEYWSRCMSAARIRNGCQEMIDPLHFTSCVFVRGNGRVRNSLVPLARERFGPDGCFELTTDRPPDSGHLEAAAATALRWRQASGTTFPLANLTVPITGSPLFVVQGERHYQQTMLPVMRLILTSGDLTLATSHNSTGHTDFESYDELLRAHPDRVVHLDHRQAPQALDGAVPRSQLQEIDGTLLDNLALPGLFDLKPTMAAAFDRCREQMAGLRDLVSQLDDLFDQSPPSIVAMARDRSNECRTFVAVARARGIPTLVIQPGLMSEFAMFNPLFAEHATVIDTYARDLYLRTFGAQSSQLSMTGFPALEQLDSGEIHRPDGSSEPTVLLTLQRTSSEQTEQLVRSVATAVQNTDPGVRLVVRPHPMSSARTVATVRDLVGGLRGRVEVNRDGPILKAIRLATVVVSQWSTTLFESAIAGVPGISVALDGEGLPIPLDELGISLLASSSAELNDTLRSLLMDHAALAAANRRQRDYLDANPHLTDPPGPTERIVSVIRNLEVGQALGPG